MPSEVILPRVDMDMATGKIAKWFVEPGAKVTKGQPLFEIETDKAAMEIEAPASGTIRDLAAASGADIAVGSVVAWIFAEGEAAVAEKAVVEPAVSAALARHEVNDKRFDAPLPQTAREARGDDARTSVAVGDPDRPRATPMARRLARTNGLDLAAITGTGPRGRIQAADITAAGAPTGDAATASPAGPMGAAVAATMLEATESSPVAAGRPRPAAATRSGGALNLVQLREGQGTPTLLVHGFGADANTWRPFLSGRASSRPVFALDLPGHGASPLGAIASFADLVDAIEAALAEAELGPIDLVGHSLGAALAAAAAARGTLDIQSLLLLSPAGLGPEINGAFLRGFLGAASEASLTPWMRQLVTDPAAITPAFVRATLKARDGTALVVTQRQVADAVFPDATQSFDIRVGLATLSMPTRVVSGTADQIIPVAQTAGLPGRVALHLLPNIGHMPQFEARELVAGIHSEMIGG